MKILGLTFNWGPKDEKIDINEKTKLVQIPLSDKEKSDMRYYEALANTIIEKDK